MRSAEATSTAGSPGRRGPMRTGKVLVGRGLHRVDHVQHREAAAIAAIQHLLRMTADRVAAEMADLLDGRATPAHPRRGRAGNSSEPLEGAG
jgi:hypothetical protein